MLLLSPKHYILWSNLNPSQKNDIIKQGLEIHSDSGLLWVSMAECIDDSMKMDCYENGLKMTEQKDLIMLWNSYLDWSITQEALSLSTPEDSDDETIPDPHNEFHTLFKRALCVHVIGNAIESEKLFLTKYLNAAFAKGGLDLVRIGMSLSHFSLSKSI